MAHQQDGARIGAQGVLEQVAAGQVEVVRGLVEHQQVHRVEQRLGQGEPGALPAREVADPPVRHVAGEAERAEHGAQVAPLALRGVGLQLLQHGALEVEPVHLVLGERGHVDVRAQLAGAGHGGELAQQHLQQRRLPGAVGAHHAQLATPLHHQIHVRQDGHAVVPDGDARQLGHIPPRPTGLGEREAGHQLALRRHLDLVELLQRLDAALHLARLRRLVAEALHEALDAGHLALLLGAHRLEPREPLLTLHHELGEAAHVLGGRAEGQLHHPVGHRVDEVAVVAHEQHRARVVTQRVLEPGHRIGVEVVGGLVEHQHVGLGQQQLRQGGAHAPTARHLAQHAVRVARREAQAVQDGLGFRLDGVTTEHLEAVLGLAVGRQDPVVLDAGGAAHPVGERGELVLELADLGRAPQHRVEHRAPRDLGQLLGQEADAQVLGTVHVARVGRLLAEQDLDERRLAGAVVPHQRRAPARDQRQGHVPEQLLAPEGFGHAGHRDHEG